MLVVRETSRGQVAIMLRNFGKAGGTQTWISRIDEEGWAEERADWNSNEEGRTLADALVEGLELPRDEAECLAAAAMSGWREHGAPEEVPHWLMAKWSGLLASAIVLFLLAVLVAIGWILIRNL